MLSHFFSFFDPSTPTHPPRRPRRLRVVPVAQRRHRLRPVPAGSPWPRPRRLHRARAVQARAEGQPAVSGRECCLFLSNGAEGDGSLSRSRIGKGPERGDRRETACGGSETFFLFFFLFCFFFDDARSKKSTTAKSLTPFQPAFFTSTPHQNRSTRPSASSRLQSRSGRSVRRPDRLDEERVTSPLFFSSTPKPKHHLVRFENPPTSPLSSFSLTSLASLVPPPPPTHPPHKTNL